MSELLFLSHRVPYPPDKGEKIRAWHELRHLSASHDIHLGCLADDPADVAHIHELRRICASVGCFTVNPLAQRARALAAIRKGRPLTSDIFYSIGLRRWVTKTLASNRIDHIFAFSSAMAGYVSGLSGYTRILDMVDIDSENWRAYGPHHSWPMRMIYEREAETLLALERQFALDFDLTLFVSESEARRFAVLAPECQDRLSWLENGVELTRFSPAVRHADPFHNRKRNLVFTGTMSYWPNAEAVTWFAQSVLPIIQKTEPRTHFHIVGASPGRSVRRLNRYPGITVTGRVPDVRPFLAHADVVVAPLRIARGIQNKVLEAMAMARPVIATPDAFEGLRAMPERDLLLASGPEEMAARILEVLAGEHPQLGVSARQAVEHHYSWCHALRPLDRLFPSVPAFTGEQKNRAC